MVEQVNTINAKYVQGTKLFIFLLVDILFNLPDNILKLLWLKKFLTHMKVQNVMYTCPNKYIIIVIKNNLCFLLIKLSQKGVDWQNKLILHRELRSRLLSTMQESPLNVVQRRVITISIFHGGSQTICRPLDGRRDYRGPRVVTPSVLSQASREA